MCLLANKVMADVIVVILVDYLHKGRTINCGYNANSLDIKGDYVGE